jgi:probable rRNA maturation factor
MAEKIQFTNRTALLKNINRKALRQSLNLTASQNQYLIQSLTCIFLTDEELRSINVEFLQHDYYTDIITFDLSEEKNNIIGEMYLSIDRIKENAVTHKTTLELELVRVIHHGVLHMCGFKDKTAIQQKAMRMAEEECLNLYLLHKQN